MVILICTSLMGGDGEHLFMCSLSMKGGFRSLTFDQPSATFKIDKMISGHLISHCTPSP